MMTRYAGNSFVLVQFQADLMFTLFLTCPKFDFLT